MKTKHLGSTFNDFLQEQGLFSKCRSAAIRFSVAQARRKPIVRMPEPDAKGNYPAIAYGRTLLARRIVAARNRADWSQAELARRAGVRKETIHRIEAGKNNPDESTFDKIEKAFAAGGVTV